MQSKDVDYNKEKILVVDDDAYLRELFKEFLQALHFSAATASSGPEALDMLNKDPYTFLLTDMKMPDMDGMDLIQQVAERFPRLSIIAMTGFSQGYRYVDVINAGASDFIKKPFDIEELEAKIRRIINERNLREELSRLSITDSLTGLYNQRHFYTRLKNELLRAKRQSHGLALILMDLDNFKAYNDNFGHLAGDEVLRNAGRLINQCIREGVDSGYRYGGDEFAVILIDADFEIAEEIGKRIQESLRENAKITASAGYTRYNGEMSVTELVAEADRNLYRAKTARAGNPDH